MGGSGTCFYPHTTIFNYLNFYKVNWYIFIKHRKGCPQFEPDWAWDQCHTSKTSRVIVLTWINTTYTLYIRLLARVHVFRYVAKWRHCWPAHKHWRWMLMLQILIGRNEAWIKEIQQAARWRADGCRSVGRWVGQWVGRWLDGSYLFPPCIPPAPSIFDVKA